VLAGDVNYGDGEPDGDGLAATWRDAWPHLHPGEPGFTWDLVRNPRAPAQSFPGEPSRRIDRAFVRGAWTATAISIIGSEPPTGSDHLGLRVVLARR
jgi:endonuclease/exonuclease/phosphatase family metal-dependent hydrolase